MSNKYTPIIGLEIHIELNTKSKMFCQCPADYFGQEPNTHTCPVCLGMPGGLPVPNEEAIRRTILFGKAIGCKINKRFKFDRKHYFYPDLPKGYQISQYDEPIVGNGNLEVYVNGEKKSFAITRVHLEEDTGKLTHKGGESLIDYNRGGVPLMEIVTEPVFHTSEDVKAFLEELQLIARYLGIANADMEKGDMRLEPNISLQLTEKLPELPEYKVEVKNINSFKFAQKAIEYELKRQEEILERGEVPPQETRGWDANTKTTVPQRLKENANDYRYFPDADIPVFEYTDEQLQEIYDEGMVRLPHERIGTYVDEWGVKYVDAVTLVKSKDTAEYFEDLVSANKTAGLDLKPQQIAAALLNKKIKISDDPTKALKEFKESTAPVETDMDKLSSVVDTVLRENQKAVDDFKSGKNPNAIMYLMGQVMRAMKGQADANIVKRLLEERI